MESPVQLLTQGDSPAFLLKLQNHHQQLSTKLTQLISTLTQTQNHNLTLRQTISQQEQLLAKLTQPEEQHSCNVSCQLKEHDSAAEKLIPYRSLELPHRKAYLDTNNRSIQTQLDARPSAANRRTISRTPQRSTPSLYGTLYSRKSYSLTRPKLK